MDSILGDESDKDGRQEGETASCREVFPKPFWHPSTFPLELDGLRWAVLSAYDPLADIRQIASPHGMTFKPTDLRQSLEQLTGLDAGSSHDAPTPMVEAVILSWKKPLNELSDEEIGRLVIQHDGYPYVLDLVWPKLENDPLFDGGYYPGDVLSNLIRAAPRIWAERPQYEVGLKSLYQRALGRSIDENDAFRESLALPEASSFPN